MTEATKLSDLADAVAKAKEWRPKHWCHFNQAAWEGLCGSEGVRPAEVDCSGCAGARRAIEDVKDRIDRSLKVGLPIEARVKAALQAARMTSYFGATNLLDEFIVVLKETSV